MLDKEFRQDCYWREKLTSEQYRICREKGTERPFSGEYWSLFDSGVYLCRACSEPLFNANAKFDAGCGWPSFYAPIDKEVIVTEFDDSHGMRRTEVLCSGCKSPLGHVFTDGPEPTGLRYCINSVSLNFIKGSA